MSKTSTNTAAVPEAKGALDRFKFEVANELGVPLSDGCDDLHLSVIWERVLCCTGEETPVLSVQYADNK